MHQRLRRMIIINGEQNIIKREYFDRHYGNATTGATREIQLIETYDTINTHDPVEKLQLRTCMQLNNAM